MFNVTLFLMLVFHLSHCERPICPYERHTNFTGAWDENRKFCVTWLNLSSRKNTLLHAKKYCSHFYKGEVLKFGIKYKQYGSVTVMSYDLPSAKVWKADNKKRILNGIIVSEQSAFSTKTRPVYHKKGTLYSALLLPNYTTHTVTIHRPKTKHSDEWEYIREYGRKKRINFPLCVTIQVHGNFYQTMEVVNCDHTNADATICLSTPIINYERDPAGGYKCKPGFLEPHCDKLATFCANKPCKEHGCINGVNTYMCDCGVGFLAKDCENPLPTRSTFDFILLYLTGILTYFVLPIMIAMVAYWIVMRHKNRKADLKKEEEMSADRRRSTPPWAKGQMFLGPATFPNKAVHHSPTGISYTLTNTESKDTKSK